MLRRLIVAIAVLSALTASMLSFTDTQDPWHGETVPERHVLELEHAHSAYAGPNTCPDGTLVPLGALPPAVPIWCFEPLATGASTFINTANGWADEWTHGLTNANIGADYQVFEFGSVARTEHFRHNQHWMVDIDGGGGKGGALLRPDRSFTAISGQLVVEGEVAPSIATYNIGGADLWPELVVTTAPAPTSSRPSPLYAYDEFAGHWTFGCRLQKSEVPICAIFDDSNGGPGDGARRYEISYFQQAGSTSYGGTPATPGLETVWKSCSNVQDPDTLCRNVYRLELTATRVTIYVNGIKYFEQTGLPPYLNNLVDGRPVYVYYADVVYRLPAVARFHWDHIAVNPVTQTAPAGRSGPVQLGPRQAAPPRRPSSTTVNGVPNPILPPRR